MSAVARRASLARPFGGAGGKQARVLTELPQSVCATARRINGIAARGESPAAFDGRCIPPRGVAHRSFMPNKLALPALRSGRLARLGATRDFRHGLLGANALDQTLFAVCQANRQRLGADARNEVDFCRSADLLEDVDPRALIEKHSRPMPPFREDDVVHAVAGLFVGPCSRGILLRRGLDEYYVSAEEAYVALKAVELARPGIAFGALCRALAPLTEVTADDLLKWDLFHAVISRQPAQSWGLGTWGDIDDKTDHWEQAVCRRPPRAIVGERRREPGARGRLPCDRSAREPTVP